ncbi:hypothetical protein A2773_03075 [Candidatus Gottesmanbacteria bacterium RIFCSPHIGHO2_01_FULL_39_10]|uniref:Uncharacterized protein n=1 Tax=Candidatus Gottesmanbacteria bacterium RIFCSPHIGHO2_01_FULL_39_10 TaxID=1798375 RepID=A0A1F5ZLJ6_9BACT|nr:MAG: hypothetical protein A2V48_02280 [Candidatus Amesbacteria bacterium RBG_19FT_COMBO_48_16]OGG12972.1 MAG: hypothetical protein A2773_03075 [Candidatus Gottesmanbacteria bacterium RIFCSPHIGHO2_01_FULL_39_10]
MTFFTITNNNSYVTNYPSSKQSRAKGLRKSGHSLGEISLQLGISKSTASLWLRDTPLNEIALKRIERKKISARLKGLEILKIQRLQKKQEIDKIATDIISTLNLGNISLCKVLCALLYWGEGSKTDYRLAFINSDPQMISTFMSLLRKSFPTTESKFRALVHIHEYHNENEIKNYWSNITKIPLSQFTKSFLKPHTGKISRLGYKGSIRIVYHDSKIASQLKATYNILAKYIGAW